MTVSRKKTMNNKHGNGSNATSGWLRRSHSFALTAVLGCSALIGACAEEAVDEPQKTGEVSQPLQFTNCYVEYYADPGMTQSIGYCVHDYCNNGRIDACYGSQTSYSTQSCEVCDRQF